MQIFEKLTVLGVGLIGGSLALACKKHELAGRIVGSGGSEGNLRTAKELGAIDAYEMDLGKAVAGADLVVLAAPVGVILKTLPLLPEYLKPGAVVTDVGSTKAEIVAAAESLMPKGCHFVGGHPIAGNERSGVQAADADLFAGAKCILTPTAQTHTGLLERVGAIWEKIGSHVVFMDAAEHDRILAAISHLPHLVAYTLVNTVVKEDDDETGMISLSGGGFRDYTRVAASNPKMWTDICLTNQQNLVDLIGKYQQELEHLKIAIRLADGEALMKGFKAASTVKNLLNGYQRSECVKESCPDEQ